MSDDVEKEGGYAFPIGDSDIFNRGMTLRDYFISHAPPIPEFWLKLADSKTLASYAEMHVRWRIVYADAMLAERAKYAKD